VTAAILSAGRWRTPPTQPGRSVSQCYSLGDASNWRFGRIGGIGAYPQRTVEDEAAVERGRAAFSANCGFGDRLYSFALY
jgi:hypothetical protein